MHEMSQLHDDISCHIDDAITIAKRMVEIAQEKEWTAAAFQDFESLERKLQQAANILKCTPEKPDNLDGHETDRTEED